MINTIRNYFDLNKKQLSKLDPQYNEFLSFRDVHKDKEIKDLRARMDEIRADIKIEVDKVPEEAKKSLRKIDRTKGLPDYEKAVQAKLLKHMPEVYALIDEIYLRKVGFRYHEVQIRAAMILGQGQRLVEMRTGEGKTMTFQLPLALYALSGRGSHLATVNDYLARIGAEYAGHFLHDLGISVGIITPQESYKFINDEDVVVFKGDEGKEAIKNRRLQIDAMTGTNLIECKKIEAYECDVTMGTNNEFGFDYLRDNMADDLRKVAQRELYFCIIDEADSILIDEARTPLIISAIPNESDTEKYTRFANAVDGLQEELDYVVDHKSNSVSLTEDGIKKVEDTLGVPNMWDDMAMVYHLDNALKAKALFHLDDQYLVKSGEVLIVDEFTGRVLKGRRYSEGLHQAIEAKEGVDIKQESKTYATITFQNYFRMYKFLCGGSGTVLTEAEEFYKIYGIESIEIPTNKPVIRIDYPDRIFKTKEAKFKHVAEEIKEKHEKGQPVLVGTVSVETSEYLSSLLDNMGVPHEVLNAKYHEQEARIVALAGKKGAVTVATNMAGRGTDIVIGGGSRGDAAWKEVADLGGLHVMGTERHDARRIDNQLRGRTGRQGEPGSTRFYVSLEDQLMKILGGEIAARLMNMVKIGDDMPIEVGIISRQIEMAQKRIESLNFDRRKSVVDYDDVMNQHREVFYSKRNNFLETVENSLGKFIKGRKIVELSSLTDDQKLEFENKQNIKKEEVRKVLKQIVIDEVEHLITLNLGNSSKVSSKVLEELIKDYILYLHKENIVSVLNERNVEDKLSNELKDLSVDAMYDYLLELAEKVVEYKFEGFKEDLHSVAKLVTLQTMDNKWVDHLEIMKDIREGIGLQGYAQRDPLVEYKNQAFKIFESFMQSVDNETGRRLLAMFRSDNLPRLQNPRLKTNENEVIDVLEGDREMLTSSDNRLKSAIEKMQKQKNIQEASIRTNTSEGSSKTITNSKFANVGRNDLCPCGSGKKFKKCHGAS